MTNRQREVIQLVSYGMTNAEIAKTLHLSEETVKTHVRKALQSLMAKNRTHAVGEAMRSGQIS